MSSHNKRDAHAEAAHAIYEDFRRRYHDSQETYWSGLIGGQALRFELPSNHGLKGIVALQEVPQSHTEVVGYHAADVGLDGNDEFFEQHLRKMLDNFPQGQGVAARIEILTHDPTATDPAVQKLGGGAGKLSLHLTLLLGKQKILPPVIPDDLPQDPESRKAHGLLLELFYKHTAAVEAA